MKWQRIWSREYSVQYCEVVLHSLGKKAEHILPLFIEKQMFIPDNKNECFYSEIEEQKKLVKSLVEAYKGDKFNSFVKLFYETAEDYLNFTKKVVSRDMKSTNNSEIKKIYLDYQRRFVDYTCIVFMEWLLNEHWVDMGLKILKTDDDLIRQALFRPEKKSAVLLMQDEAKKIKGKKEEYEKFLKKYQWLPCLDIQNKPWTLEDIEDYIENIKIGKTEESMTFEQAVEKAVLSEKEVGEFKIIKELTYLKDIRDDYRRQAIFNIRKFFEEIGRRVKLPVETLAYLTEEELLKLLDDKKVDMSQIEKRKQGFMMYLNDNEAVCVVDSIKEELDKLGFSEDKIETSEIKGTIACKGKAKGRVKIVCTVHDILKVDKGDILVAVTTHPDYLPAMQKAVAIVTDEGGLSSHAAIVSRELGIPCIVGTKKATKILDNGMLVEVDADEGIVKVIK